MKTSRTKRARIWLGIFLIIILLSALFLAHRIFVWRAPLDYPISIEIPEGSGSNAIARILYKNELIENELLFRLTARFSGSASRLRAGRHIISKPLSTWELTEKLAREGGMSDIKITIPEGWTIFQIAKLLEDSLGIDTTAFYQTISDPRLLDSLGISAPNMEGYLYPETYFFPREYRARDVVIRMYEHSERVWNERQELAHIRGFTKNDLLTLASIIEAEATFPDEREVISSVYNNRLDIDMMLQADPTTIYGLRKFDKPLLLVDLKDDSPYNTYRHKGLPPGPICNPSEACIDAALNPADTPYFYFVAQQDRSHIFSRTLDEHHRAIRKVRANR